MTAWHNSHLEYDWFRRALPGNIGLGANVYIDSSYSFAPFFSSASRALVMGEGSGAYRMSSFAAGPAARIKVGAFTCFNGTLVVADDEITIGSHCLFAWSTFITDTRMPSGRDVAARRRIMGEIARDPLRRLRPVTEPRPVRIEDNVWVGFSSTVLGGVTIGRGAIIGCKTVIREDVPPYAVMVGNPPKAVRYLAPDDGEESRLAALREFGLSPAVSEA
jgi:acetyltransferase-like isoleucine patch superfamily enzyme